jgi:hypothetical protein
MSKSASPATTIVPSSVVGAVNAAALQGRARLGVPGLGRLGVGFEDPDLHIVLAHGRELALVDPGIDDYHVERGQRGEVVHGPMAELRAVRQENPLPGGLHQGPADENRLLRLVVELPPEYRGGGHEEDVGPQPRDRLPSVQTVKGVVERAVPSAEQ